MQMTPSLNADCFHVIKMFINLDANFLNINLNESIAYLLDLNINKIVSMPSFLDVNANLEKLNAMLNVNAYESECQDS